MGAICAYQQTQTSTDRESSSAQGRTGGDGDIIRWARARRVRSTRRCRWTLAPRGPDRMHAPSSTASSIGISGRTRRLTTANADRGKNMDSVRQSDVEDGALSVPEHCSAEQPERASPSDTDVPTADTLLQEPRDAPLAHQQGQIASTPPDPAQSQSEQSHNRPGPARSFQLRRQHRHGRRDVRATLYTSTRKCQSHSTSVGPAHSRRRTDRADGTH